MPVTIDGSNGITTPTYGGADTAEYLVPVTQFKSRIINGGMTIDQRNAGATVSSHLAFPVDRFQIIKDTPTGTFTSQRSTVAPSDFVNSLLFTVGTAFTASSSQNNFIRHIIEGFNVADLNWGTANAKTVTLSFWVRSSVTGTFGGSLRNAASNRSYPFTYSINSANTFEYKTITIAGDTTGTWVVDNGKGIEISWGLSVGSTFSGTAGAWAAGDFISATGAVSLTSTASATWYITGVQLERGSTATSFDYRPYGTELALCQRYYEKSFAIGTAPAEGLDTYATGGCAYGNNGLYVPSVQFKVQKRTAPSITIYRPSVHATNGAWGVFGGASWASATTSVAYTLEQSFTVDLTSNVTDNNGYAIVGSWAASAEL